MSELRWICHYKPSGVFARNGAQALARFVRSWKEGELVTRVAPFKARNGLAGILLINNENDKTREARCSPRDSRETQFAPFARSSSVTAY